MAKLSNPQHEMFCILFASDKEFFGNGVESYAEAYDIDVEEKGQYKVAASGASRLLTNAGILTRIDELLDLIMNDQVVDKQLAYWIQQKANPQASVGAIKEYNALKQRVIKRIEGKIELDIPESLVRFAGDDNPKDS